MVGTKEASIDKKSPAFVPHQPPPPFLYQKKPQFLPKTLPISPPPKTNLYQITKLTNRTTANITTKNPTLPTNDNQKYPSVGHCAIFLVRRAAWVTFIKVLMNVYSSSTTGTTRRNMLPEMSKDFFGLSAWC